MKVFNLALLFIIGCSSISSFGESKLPWKEKKASTKKVEALNEVGVVENLGDSVDLNLELTDENGKTVQLGDYFKKERPVLLTLVYYSCPSLCNFHLNAVTETLKQLKWTTGEEFEFVAVSFEPKDTPEIAGLKKKSYLKEYGREAGSKGWHFLTGTEENVAKLAEQVGFGYKWDPESKQWAHAAVAYVMTPEGRLSRYLYGISFEPKTLRLSLVEASNGVIGSVIDKFILYCFNYNPKDRKYSLVAFNAVRAGAGLTVLVLSVLLIPFWLKNWRKGRKAS